MFTLEKLCLDLIVQKFERFYFAFTVSQDDNLQRNFDFLQRRFSAQLAQTLFEAHKLKEEYLELLINEHLNFFNDTWLTDIGHKFSWNDVYLRLPNLKEVVLWGCEDESLECLAKFCPKLVEIGIIGGSKVTDKGVKCLCIDKNGVIPCPELKNLSIRSTGVTESGAAYLIRNLPSLERLRYPNVPSLLQRIHEEDLHEFKTVKYYNLVKLSFLWLKNISNRTEILKTCLTVCPKLKSLSFDISDKEQLILLSNYPLKKLNLEFPLLHPKFDINFFLNLKVYYITSLKLTFCSMSISTLGLHFPVLNNFNAVRVKFSIDDDDDLKLNFSALSKCEFTNIEEPSSQKAICLILSSSPKLESVTFRDFKLSRELKTRILLWGKSPCSKFIRLYGMDIASEMEFLEDLFLKSPSLKKLSLSLYYEFKCLFDIPECKIWIEKLRDLAKTLPNKPEIYIFGEGR